jgi:predicted nucleic acid-binding protein
MNPDRVVVDANIAFKSLVSRRGDLRDRLDPSGNLKFHAPGYLFVELFKHKDRLIHATKLTPDDLLQALQALVSRLEFVNEANITLGLWMEAHRLCKDVDENDTPYVALTLHLDGRLWTEDAELKKGLRAKGFERLYEP